ncbi:MAG: hypothetical protein IPL24_04615 [Bacteroidetes bacterium]|nr:hypothetical protein [Bacteroidota bacterium]
MKNITFTKCREYILNAVKIQSIFPNLESVFQEASVDTLIFLALKGKGDSNVKVYSFKNQVPFIKHSIEQKRFSENERLVIDVESQNEVFKLLEKIRAKSIKLQDIAEITRGVNP